MLRISGVGLIAENNTKNFRLQIIYSLPHPAVKLCSLKADDDFPGIFIFQDIPVEAGVFVFEVVLGFPDDMLSIYFYGNHFYIYFITLICIFKCFFFFLITHIHFLFFFLLYFL